METAIQKNRYDIGRLHAAEIFGAIHKRNGWLGGESVSGPGSDVDRCKNIIDGIPKLLKLLNIGSVLDIPCGDWNWMKEVDLNGVCYVGADIVPEITKANTINHPGPNRAFMTLDILDDRLPEMDLVLCRDCLVHFSFADIDAAIANIMESGARYLLTTTFTDQCRNNVNISTGQWRALNLEKHPFDFPKPLQIITENNTGENADKSLALWELK